MSSVFHYGSSLRIAPIAETLEHARRLGPKVGIARVTDTTRLDRVGVPVFAGIRPDAMVRSLCVSSGKGLTYDEARIGAYMEAIELAFAEPGRAHVRVVHGTARDVLDGKTRPNAIADLCPSNGKSIAPAAPLPCVEAESVSDGGRVLVPAELVLFPLDHEAASYFGSDGNGISSGNSVLEATVHGLTEVIERDVTSFLNAKDLSLPIYSDVIAGRLQATRSIHGKPLRDTLPPTIAELVRRLDAIGFDLFMRYLPNPFAMPVVKAMIYERGSLDGMHFGYACHLSSATAMTRAACEAIQCRLTVIHGGRDDLTRIFAERAQMSAPEKQRFIERHATLNLDERHGVINFDELPDESRHTTSLDDALQFLVGRLAERGLRQVLRVTLTPPDLPLQVTRVIVPGLEMYAHGIFRMGPRLKRYLHELGSAEPETSPREASR